MKSNPDCACAGRNRDGTPCMRNAQYGQVCWQHMPPHRPEWHPGFENCDDPEHFERSFQ